MPSSSKTARLGLNRFSGTDKPKMDDFNFDNCQLDQLVGGHMEDAIAHLTAQERQQMMDQAVVTGSYVGNGAASREIPLGFAPKAGIVFGVGALAMAVNPASTGQTMAYSGFFSGQGCSDGLSISGSTLTVHETVGSSGGPVVMRLNSDERTYFYLAFRQ